MFAASILAFLSIASLASASPILQSRDSTAGQQSPSFNLMIESSNVTLNGSFLRAIHSGAAIEELAVGGKVVSIADTAYTFNFNYSTANAGYENVSGPLGTLVWTLHGSNFNSSQPLSFLYEPGYDTAVPQFQPALGLQVGFHNEYLVLPFLTETSTGKPTYSALDRWYTCKYPATQTSGYSYFALAWKLGAGTPDNASCSKVSVKRVY